MLSQEGCWGKPNSCSSEGFRLATLITHIFSAPPPLRPPLSLRPLPTTTTTTTTTTTATITTSTTPPSSTTTLVTAPPPPPPPPLTPLLPLHLRQVTQAPGTHPNNHFRAHLSPPPDPFFPRAQPGLNDANEKGMGACLPCPTPFLHPRPAPCVVAPGAMIRGRVGAQTPLLEHTKPWTSVILLRGGE
ncbi:hypothetical protein E2C01_042958 [Portunus trituberculatus]|uniref:Uncharacterized protein n=1 Tax=Portunus trituberculatus TaxID=210409 RepID=A0A5B7FW21_PORTR|nr:hypothetical protein [Portunus trituberculatus]